MVVQTFENPAIPFKTDLILGMLPGRTVIVKGNIYPVDVAEDLIFTFSTGIHVMDDVLFNMVFDFYDNTVYMNSYLDLKWGEAETIPEIPFHPGNPFEVEVGTNNKEFYVTLKGKDYCTYKHREVPTKITMFEVGGDAALTVVEVWDDLGIQTRMPAPGALPRCPLA